MRPASLLVPAAPASTPQSRAASVRTRLALSSGPRRAAWRGFTLVEMLVVMAVIVLLMALIVPAFTQVNTGRQLTRAAYDITGLLDNARAYAKANSTYTWVGFFEEGSNGVAGTGRLVASAVASRDAMAMYTGTDTNPPPLTESNLLQISNLLKIDNLRLCVLNSGEIPARGKVPDSSGTLVNVPAAYQLGDTDPAASDNFAKRSAVPNRTTFGYPLTAATPAYTFVKIIQFNPLGDATKIVDTPTMLMEIGLRTAHNGVAEAAGKNCVAIQVSGIGGQARIYQP